MKNTFQKTRLVLAFLLVANFVMAQAPQAMSYQSVIRNSSNVLLANTQVGIQISVLQGNAAGNPVYVETQTATTNTNGLVSLQIGSGTATTGTFAGIDWSAGPYFIKTETDPTGGSNYTITGSQQMMSVPYALYAAKSGDATSLGPIGTSSNPNGATLSSGVLSLAPADATNGGIVTTGEQTFAGAKIFSSDVVINGTPFGTNGIPGNVTIGANAGQTTQAANSVAIGNAAGQDSQGPSAVAMGYNAGFSFQGNSSVAIGNAAGQVNQGQSAVAMGDNAGQTTQAANSVAIGNAAGQTTQGDNSVAIGSAAGQDSQGHSAVAMGINAGQVSQGPSAVAMGINAGSLSQGNSSVAIGNAAGLVNQGQSAVAMGDNAGYIYQGANSIAIGNAAGSENQAANSIILNASGAALNNSTSGLFIKPIRSAPSSNVLSYDPISGEVTYSTGALYAAKSGASSNANGGTLNSGVLSLTPADATNGGIITAGAQTFAGNKTFNGTTTSNQFRKTGGTATQYLMADGSTSTGKSYYPLNFGGNSSSGSYFRFQGSSDDLTSPVSNVSTRCVVAITGEVYSFTWNVSTTTSIGSIGIYKNGVSVYSSTAGMFTSSTGLRYLLSGIPIIAGDILELKSNGGNLGGCLFQIAIKVTE